MDSEAPFVETADGVTVIMIDPVERETVGLTIVVVETPVDWPLAELVEVSVTNSVVVLVKYDVDSEAPFVNDGVTVTMTDPVETETVGLTIVVVATPVVRLPVFVMVDTRVMRSVVVVAK